LFHDVIGIVYWLGKPAVIPDEEIITIKRFISLYFDVLLEKIPVATQDRKYVLGDSQQIQDSNSRLELTAGFVMVRLPSLGYTLKVNLTRESINTPDPPILDNCDALLSEKSNEELPNSNWRRGNGIFNYINNFLIYLKNYA
jgi:hypothetical protein